jgi:thermitase
MKRTSVFYALRMGIILTAVLNLVACSLAAGHIDPSRIEPQAAPNRIIVKFSQDAAPTVGDEGRLVHTQPPAIELLNSRLGLRAMDAVVPRTARRNPSAAADLGLDRVWTLTFDGPIDAPAAAELYARCPGVEYAEPDWVRHVDWEPNDAYVGQQYALEYIQAPAAWDTTRGSANTVIAIIDTGVDYTHPEFAGKVLSGCDLVDGISTLDLYGHGTHVAGIAAAEADNSIGIAGVASECRILPVRVLDEEGSGYTSDCAVGVIWAADNGADVINMSYGSYTYSQMEDDAVAYAIRCGVVCVASKGNDSTWVNHYPSDYPGVIAVGATDTADQDWMWSNFGPNTWIKAPGESIISTMPTYDVTLNEPPYDLPQNYGYMTGTSTAAPQVAAAAAIVRSLNPALGPYDVAYILARSADDMGDSGFDWSFGYGRLNLYQAVEDTLADMIHDVGIVDIRTSPSDISVGESGAILVDIANSGNCAEAPLSVRVWVDGDLLDAQTPTLWPGERSTVQFAWRPTEPKTYDVIARCEPRFGPDISRSDNYRREFFKPTRYNMGITNVGILPQYAYAGAWNRIRITLKNRGTQDEPRARVKAFVGGTQVENTKLVSVAAGESVNVDFFWAPPTDAPTYFRANPVPARYTVEARVESGLGPDIDRSDNYRRRSAFAHAHNMAITDVRVLGTPKANAPQTIQLTVKNKGTRVEKDAIAKVFVNGQIVQTAIGVTLGVGKSAVVDFTWVPANPGYYTLEARTEPSEQPDVCRDDNYRRAGVHVK